ncbi:hypothetical protein ACBJ59_16445 [Nonomuraea sp. MTCD27]|uniref:hypothetical protein n=1 Tax=Nonomuraea sp. MTCD27 TaxID=1676747 RepID=UPI0035C019ED
MLISSLMVTVSVALPLVSPTWPVQLAGAVIGGVGFGACLSVDQALVTLVLLSLVGALIRVRSGR